MEYFKAHLIEKKLLAPEITLFRFRLDPKKPFNFVPGQYLILIIEEERRLYSIASPDTQKETLELLVRLLPQGVGSNYLRNLEIDDPVFFQGPAGFFTLKSPDKPKVFLATGTGIAPIRSQIFSYLAQGGQASIKLFWGLPRKDSLYLYDEFRAQADQHPNFYLSISLDQETNFVGLDVEDFKRGRVDQTFSDFVKENKISPTELNNSEYYLCGARQIVESLKEFLLGLGINKENIFFDKF